MIWLNTKEGLKKFIELLANSPLATKEGTEEYLKENKEFWEVKKIEFYGEKR